MPRPSLVPRDDAIAVIEKYIDYFRTNEFPPYCSPVWKDMSKDLGQRWSHHNCYTSIREDRRKILTAARENQGIVLPEPEPKLKKPKIQSGDYEDLQMLYDDDDDDVEVEEELFTDSKYPADDMSDFEIDAEASGLAHFDVLITRTQWQEMKSQRRRLGKRDYTTLTPGIWTNILALAVAKQTRLPCAFVFNTSKIYESPNSLHYLRIKGHCRSKACQNEFFGYVDRDPGDNDFYMTVRTRDTMGESHEDVHRPLKGISGSSRRRRKFGEEVLQDGCQAMRKHAAKYVNIYLCRRCNYPNILNKTM